MIWRCSSGEWYIPQNLGAIMAKIDLEGGFTVPRKLGTIVVAGGFMFLGQQLWAASELRATVLAKIDQLSRYDVESKGRGDELRGRVGRLEQQRADIDAKLARVEEQGKMTLDLLREMREDVRRGRP